MAWDGTYFYVVDQSGKVYAYDSSWAYQSGRSFYLHSANTGPRGITWDGTYFYVVDRTDDKVYVYDSDGNHVG